MFELVCDAGKGIITTPSVNIIMAKKCIGFKENTGGPCNRSASRGSDFCFMHKSQEGDQKIPGLQHDVYYCPLDGRKLLYEPKKGFNLASGRYRCKSCHGTLFDAKTFDQSRRESFLQLPHEVHEVGTKAADGLVWIKVACPSCDDMTTTTAFDIEWQYKDDLPISITTALLLRADGQGDQIKGTKLMPTREHVFFSAVAQLWSCDNCGSIWVPGAGMKPDDYHRQLFRDLDSPDWLQIQGEMRESRQAAVAEEVEAELEKQREKAAKLCQHLDSDGKQCHISKSTNSTHDSDYCWKHQPE